MPKPKKNSPKGKPSGKQMSDSDTQKVKGGAVNAYLQFNSPKSSN